MRKPFRYLTLLSTLWLVSYPMPALADAWPGSKIGDGFGVAAKPERTSEEDLAKIKAYGFNYIRFDMRWGEVERQRERYNWDRFDDFIAKMRAHQLKAVIILNSGNRVYTGTVDISPRKSFGASLLTAAPKTEEDIRAFVTFAEAAVKRYGSKDIIWEIWNEPDGYGFWPPHPDAELFAKLADLTCRTLRRTMPDAMIIAPGIANLPGKDDFLAPVIKSSTDCLTALSIHPYRLEKDPETVMDDYEHRVRPFIARHTPYGQKPLSFVVSEWGYPTNKVPEEKQAAYLIRTHLTNLQAGVPMTIWYEWKDSRPGPSPNDIEAHFGIVDYEGKDKLAGTEIQQLMPLIKDAVIEKKLPSDNVNCFVLDLRQPNGTKQILAWVTNPHMAKGKLRIGTENFYPLTPFPQLFNNAQNAEARCE